MLTAEDMVPQMKDLPWLPWLLLGATIVVCLFFRRRAPAVALGLLGGIVGGVVGFITSGGTEVPTYVATFALLGLVPLGLIGLAFMPRASARFLLLAGVFFLAAAPIAGWITWIVMHYWTCYAYDPPDRRWCGGADVFGGTSGVVTATAVLIMFALAGLLLCSAWRVKAGRASPATRPDDAQRAAASFAE
jgi:hypothetical protein